MIFLCVVVPAGLAAVFVAVMCWAGARDWHRKRPDTCHRPGCVCADTWPGLRIPVLPEPGAGGAGDPGPGTQPLPLTVPPGRPYVHRHPGS